MQRSYDFGMAEDLSGCKRKAGLSIYEGKIRDLLPIQELLDHNFLT